MQGAMQKPGECPALFSEILINLEHSLYFPQYTDCIPIL